MTEMVLSKFSTWIYEKQDYKVFFVLIFFRRGRVYVNYCVKHRELSNNAGKH